MKPVPTVLAVGRKPRNLDQSSTFSNANLSRNSIVYENTHEFHALSSSENKMGRFREKTMLHHGKTMERTSAPPIELCSQLGKMSMENALENFVKVGK